MREGNRMNWKLEGREVRVYGRTPCDGDLGANYSYTLIVAESNPHVS
jgi:hypothetical protein